MSLVQLARLCRVAGQHSLKVGNVGQSRTWFHRMAVIQQAMREGAW
jgi:hypothetical protein